MSESHNLDSTIKNHPVVVYGTALCIGFAGAVAVMQTGMSLFGRTLVSTDEVRQNEKSRSDLKDSVANLTRELESARAAAQGTLSQKDRTTELERRIQILASENARLQLDLKGATERAVAFPAAKRSEASDAATSSQVEPQKRLAVEGQMASRPTDPAPAPARHSLELKAGAPVVIDQSLTITLNHTRSYGGQFVVNGQKHSYQSVGKRISVTSAAGKRCFLEVMSLSPETASPNTARLDYVCAAKV